MNLLIGGLNSLVSQKKDKEILKWFLIYNLICISQIFKLMSANMFNVKKADIISNFNSLIQKSQSLLWIENTDQTELFNNLKIRWEAGLSDGKMNNLAKDIWEINIYNIRKKIQNPFDNWVKREIRKKLGFKNI
jgi:hypothetical protein